MVKLMKFVVLASGLIGLIAFFLPLVAVQESGVEGKLSAFQIVKGIDSVQDVVRQAPRTGTAEEARVVEDANRELSKIRTIVLAVFGPAAVLFVLGLIATLRRRFGRGLAILTVLVGLIGLGIWALLDSAASEVGGTQDVKGVAIHLLLVTGVGGALAGLVCTIAPDRG